MRGMPIQRLKTTFRAALVLAMGFGGQEQTPAQNPTDSAPAAINLRVIDPAKPSAQSPTSAAPGMNQPTPASQPTQTYQPIPATQPASPSQPTPAAQPAAVKASPLQDPMQPSVGPNQAGASPAANSAAEPLKPIPADPPGGAALEIEVASFNGITPGVTTAAELQKVWGPPKEVRNQEGAVVNLYAIAPFNQVEVMCFEGKVSSVLIRFDKPFPASAIVKQLQLTKVTPVLISNETGEVLGQSFPEKGVLLSFEASPEPGKISMKVTQIILEPLSAEPFVLRAETYFDSNPSRSLRDLEEALKLQTDNARAYWLQSRIEADMAEVEKAQAAAQQAVRLEPDNPQYRVTLGQIMAQAGHFGEAVQEAEKAVKLAERRPHVKARALCLLGDLAGASPTPDLKQAVHYHMEAVKTADPLSTNKHPAIRVAAKEVLLDAHLGAAYDVAWGAWKDKDTAVARWLEQASVFSEDLIKNEAGSEAYRLRLDTRALAAGVGARGAFDPGTWIEDTIRVGRKLIDATEDPLRKAQYQWEVGMAVYDSLQIYQLRGQHDVALKYGELAIQFLGSDQQKRTPAAEYLLGRLYFRIGAAYALRDKNHPVAVTWFDKAIPLLEKPLPQEAYADLGRHGETFVSMGVSYWDVGQRDKAMELTQRGVGLMESAVKQGLLDEPALTVAYNNLATIHRTLGEPENAQRFESMANHVRQSTAR
jgi:tetratricopeptide (TPR) repeat protein